MYKLCCSFLVSASISALNTVILSGNSLVLPEWTRLAFGIAAIIAALRVPVALIGFIKKDGDPDVVQDH